MSSWLADVPVIVPITSTALGTVLALFAATEIEASTRQETTTVVASPVAAPPDEPIPVAAPPVVVEQVVKAVPPGPQPSQPRGPCAPPVVVHFAEYTDIASLDDAAIERFVAWVDDHNDAQIIVQGHADETGTAEFNMALSHKRAKVVGALLREAGIEPERLSIQAFGEYKPRLGIRSNDARQRRVVVEVADVPTCTEEAR